MYFWGLVMMIVSIPLSRYMMSVSQFTLSGILILEFVSLDQFRKYLRRYPVYIHVFLFLPVVIYGIIKSITDIFRTFLRKENMPAIVFASLYVLHLLGLLFTVDFDYALKDLRIKLPLMVLPVILSVSDALDWKKFRMLMLFFVASVIFGTFVSTFILISRDIDNLRDISIFISHIRFSLLISIAMFALAYFLTPQAGFKSYMRIIFMIALGWLGIYLILSASITGIVVLLIAVFVMALYFTMKKRNIYSRISLVVLVLAPTILFVYLMGVITDVYKVHKVDLDNLDKQTARGNFYWHDLSNQQTENGYYVWLYICTDELRSSWNERSTYDFDGEDSKGQLIRFTLIRYMTSRGLRKDAEGVSQLTDEDISLIESGEASYHYHERSVFYVRLYKIIWEVQQYLRTGDPSGYSAMQRIEYWKTSLQIIRQHPLIGVGTGDMNIAFERQYEIMNSLLKPEFRWRSHNQFFSIGVGFGIIGVLWFIVSLLYPAIRLKRFSDYFYLSFFVIMVVSMISEDTIETQAGVTIFAFFTSLFLFGKKDINPI